MVSGDTIVKVRVDDGPSGTGPGEVELSRSSDGGQTWTTSVVLTTPLPIMEAEIAGDRRGLLGLSYYTVNLNDASCQGTSATIPATTIVRVSGDNGTTWSAPQIIGARAWNIASAGAELHVWLLGRRILRNRGHAHRVRGRDRPRDAPRERAFHCADRRRELDRRRGG